MVEGGVVFEWQSRHNISLTWAPGKRRQWTDESGNDGDDPTTGVLAPGKPKYKPLVIEHVTDAEGWVYAFDFATFAADSTQTETGMHIEKATDFVRRRSWAPERSQAVITAVARPPTSQIDSFLLHCRLQKATSN